MTIRLFEFRREMYQLLPKHTVGAELGVEHGDNAELLIEASQPKILHLVDNWHHSSPDDVQARFAGQSVNVVRSDDVAWLQSLPTDVLDWVYIDTLHTYEHTMRELAACRGKVKYMIAGHDWCCTSRLNPCPYVREWVRDGGVLRAVIEQVQAGWLELIALTTGEKYPSWMCKILQ